MNITPDLISDIFDRFNTLIFNDELLPLTIRITSAHSYLGKMTSRISPDLKGHSRHYDFKMLVSRHHPQDRALLEDTVIHEMIHYYIMSKEIKDTSSHGRVFRSMMRDINTRFKRKITISHKITPDTPVTASSPGSDIRQHILCVMRLDDGKLGVMIPARTLLFRFYDEIQLIRQVKVLFWCSSTHPFFNRYPRCRSLKFYLAEPSELKEALADAAMIEMTAPPDRPRALRLTRIRPDISLIC